jgi:hypothetical protein
MPATAQDTATLKAALLAKGMLADRGRYTPFASVAGDADAVVPDTSGTSALQSAVAGNAATGGAVVTPPVAATTDSAVDPKTALPIGDDTLNKMSEGDATDLLVALGVTGAAALTAYLARRRAKLTTPTVEGTVIDSEPAESKAGIVDGEFTEVKPKQIGNTKLITQGYRGSR